VDGLPSRAHAREAAVIGHPSLRSSLHSERSPDGTQDSHWLRVELDVGAIITGMALAHGGRVVASRPAQ
jgi:hypothetical protein